MVDENPDDRGRVPAALRPLAPLRPRRWLGFPATPPPIGRDDEVGTLSALVREPGRRLVTLTGPGGVGKTRLALAVAAAVAPAFADGAAFVALAAVSDPTLLLAAIAGVLDLRETPGWSPRELLVAALRDREFLLVLDNFEHLAGDAASADVAALYQDCAGVRFLITSRTPLHLHDELRFATPALALPAADAAPDPERLAQCGSIALFVERARMAHSSFHLSEKNALAVVEICRRLDGLPLAIELAAAWVRVLPPAALLEKLEPRLALLRGGAEDQPARLRTMRDAIDWSYALLTDEERRLFRCLGVFVGGFTLDASEWVTAPSRQAGGSASRRVETAEMDPATRHPPPATLDLLARLVDKSLVQQIGDDGAEPRFTMLETVRAFALERLAEAGHEDAMRDRHAAWCLALAERAELQLVGPDQADWFARLDAEHPNFRAALTWLLAQGEGERGVRLASALTWFWSSRGYFREARAWLDALLVLPLAPAMRARGLHEISNIRHWQGDLVGAKADANEALALFQANGDRYFAMCTLRRLASLAISEAEYAQAARFLAECEALRLDLGAGAGYSAVFLAGWDPAFAIYLDGRLALATGRHEDAVARFAAAAEAFRAIGDRGYVAAARGQQGAALLGLGELTAARAAFAESLALACELRDQTWIAAALAGSAHLAHEAGDHPTAARLLGAATALRETIGERRLPPTALDTGIQAVLGEERFASEWSLGALYTEAQSVAAARAILGSEARRRRTPASDRPPARPLLTRRERQVLALLIEGRSDSQIAQTLFIGQRTASTHVGAILRKLGVGTRAEAAVHAVREGLV